MRSIVWRKENTATISYLWNMVVVVSWFVPVLLHLGQDGLPTLMEQWIHNYTWEYQRNMLGHLSMNWILKENGDKIPSSCSDQQLLESRLSVEAGAEAQGVAAPLSVGACYMAEVHPRLRDLFTSEKSTHCPHWFALTSPVSGGLDKML